MTQETDPAVAAEPSTAEQTVSEILVDYLARAGVEHIFGVAGSTIMPILDAMESDGRIDYVGARYELSAVEMASGYARTGGRLAVSMTHVGPGVTSCITAMVGAARDGVPILLITGNEESDTLAREPYHDWELLRVMGAITPFSYRITRADELPHVMRRALGVATRGVTHPVHIDLPEDIALQTVPADTAAQWLQLVEPALVALGSSPAAPISRPAPSSREIGEAVRLLAGAERPLLVLGETVQWTPSRDDVVQRCEKLGVPYVTSFGARGGVHASPRFAGTIGRFGSRDTNAVAGEADVIVTLGAELSDVDTVKWSIFDPDVRLVSVHPDSSKIDKRLPPTLGIVADVDEFLAGLDSSLGADGVAVPTAWLDRVAEIDRTNGPLGNTLAVENPSLDAQLVARAVEAAPDSWVVSMDPGFGALTLSAAADFGGTRFLYPYGLGVMGFAIPAAIGATFGADVDGGLAVIGDGALFMSLSSLESIASLAVPVVVIVLDDGGFGSQRKKQQEGYGRNVGVDYENPDIAAIAAGMGIESLRVETVEDIDKLCASLPGRTHGAVAVVERSRTQEGSWYEGKARRH